MRILLFIVPILWISHAFADTLQLIPLMAKFQSGTGTTTVSGDRVEGEQRVNFVSDGKMPLPVILIGPYVTGDGGVLNVRLRVVDSDTGTEYCNKTWSNVRNGTPLPCDDTNRIMPEGTRYEMILNVAVEGRMATFNIFAGDEGWGYGFYVTATLGDNHWKDQLLVYGKTRPFLVIWVSPSSVLDLGTLGCKGGSQRSLEVDESTHSWPLYISFTGVSVEAGGDSIRFGPNGHLLSVYDYDNQNYLPLDGTPILFSKPFRGYVQVSPPGGSVACPGGLATTNLTITVQRP